MSKKKTVTKLPKVLYVTHEEGIAEGFGFLAADATLDDTKDGQLVGVYELQGQYKVSLQRDLV